LGDGFGDVRGEAVEGRRLQASAGDGGEEAGGLQRAGEGEDEVGGGDGCEAETGSRGVLEVRTHVREVDEGHNGWCCGLSGGPKGASGGWRTSLKRSWNRY